MRNNNYSSAFHTQDTRPTKRQKPQKNTLWMVLIQLIILITAGLGAYFVLPGQITILFLGIDRAPGETALGRSDTMILMRAMPRSPHVVILSIPRDLWVEIPEIGENRINTAHFYAEADLPGSGPQAAIETVGSNFGIEADYYIRLHLENVQTLVDAIGGIDVDIPEAVAGFPPGTHHLNGEQALAFIRDRQGSDFSRMAQGQIFIRALIGYFTSPDNWPEMRGVLNAIGEVLETNIPAWQYPRLAAAFFFAGTENIQAYTLDQTMVTPYTTEGGAQVLLPDWVAINTLLMEIFGRGN